MKHSSPAPSRSRLLPVATVILTAAVVAIIWFVTAPEESAPRLAAPPARPVSRPMAKPAPPPVLKRTPPVEDPSRIDPEIQRLADNLAAKTETPVRDLEMVDDFIDLYRKVFQQGNPIGLNEDITAVLTGRNAKNGILFPPNSPMIVKGQLVDRWGTPYWFHPSSGHQMEIRSAGPDKELFTPDDIVKNPGPDNMGIGAGAVSAGL